MPWKLFLLAASYFFYGCWDEKYLLLILFISVSTYVFSFLIVPGKKSFNRKLFLTISLLICLVNLGFFKYYDFFREPFNNFLFAGSEGLPLLDIVLPVGISFFTFQAISYLIDVYRGEVTPESGHIGLLNYLVYIAFFPQLVAGPIVRAKVFLPQFKPGYIKAIPNMNLAVFLIMGGLFKKLILSTYLQTELVEGVMQNPLEHSSLEVLMAIYGYSVQIYCDFSGYSDIAIGTALLLGFRFPDNFNNPYRAVNIQDFWRRWHITLSTWLRDYLYIPLGGNRNGIIAMYGNLMITMLIGGLWHGASLSFVFWGGLHGLALVLNKIWQALKERFNLGSKKNRWTRFLAIFTTFHFVTFLWVPFYHHDIDKVKEVFNALANNLLEAPTDINLFIIIAIILGIAIHFIGDIIEDLYLSMQKFVPYMVQVPINAAILITIVKIGPKTVPPFIYFQF